MGHALVAASLPDVDPVLKVSIIPRGVGALGYTIQRPTEDRFLLARSELRHRITVLMGGRAAEVLLFDGDISTGAADDLQRATEIAVEMVTLYGMAQVVGQRTYKPAPQMFLSGQGGDKPVASEATLREIDLSVRDIVADAFAAAREILTRRRADLDKGAELLLTKEAITADDFPQFGGASWLRSPCWRRRCLPKTISVSVVARDSGLRRHRRSVSGDHFGSRSKVKSAIFRDGQVDCPSMNFHSAVGRLDLDQHSWLLKL